MTFPAITVALPIADRRTSCDFYRAVLTFDPLGSPAGDGMPEPLQFGLNDGARLMLVPTDGFGFVLAGRPQAPTGHSECILSLPVVNRADVDAVTSRAAGAGGSIVSPPAEQPWGYCAVIADPDGHLWLVTPV